MKIIADPETGGLHTIALAIDWGLPQECQVHGCEEKGYAILCFTKEETEAEKPLDLVICKKHYEKGRAKGSIRWRFNI